MKVNVLGTKYTIKKDVKPKDEPHLNDCDGYCDPSTKIITIAEFKPSDDTFRDLQAYEDRVIRHELVHAFLFESGLDINTDWARNEEIIDWIALQFPKMFKAYDRLEVM